MAEPGYDIVVVGGGIAGLSAAWELRDRRVLLLEAEAATSGRVKSAQRGEYFFNLGAQFLGGEGPLHGYVKELGIEVLPIEGARPAIALKNSLVASDSAAGFVFKLPLSLRGRFQMARTGLKLRRAYNRLTHNPNHEDAVRFRSELDEQSIREFLGGVTDRGVWSIWHAMIRLWMGAEPEELSAGHSALYLGLSVMPAKEIPPLFLPRGGNQAIPRALTERLGERVRTNARVTSVEEEEGGVRVTYHDGSREVAVTSRRCIVAVPAYAAREVVQGLGPQQAEALESVHYGSFLVAGLVTNETRPMPWDHLYAVTVADRSFQVLFNHSVVLRRGPRRPGGALVVYASGEPARRLMDRPDPEVEETFVRDLYEVFPQARGIVQEVVIQRWPKAIPYWNPGGRRHKEVLRRPMGSIHFAGDYIAYPSMQTAATAGVAAAKAAREALAGS